MMSLEQQSEEVMLLELFSTYEAMATITDSV